MAKEEEGSEGGNVQKEERATLKERFNTTGNEKGDKGKTKEKGFFTTYFQKKRKEKKGGTCKQKGEKVKQRWRGGIF